MTAAPQPSSAFDQVRRAYEQMAQRQREAILRRKARERARNIAVSILCACLFALLLGVAAYNDWIPSSARFSTVSRGGDTTFGETRVGQLRSYVAGDTCRELQFSNENGSIIGGTLVPCAVEVSQEPRQAERGARLNSIRDAFKAR